MPKAYHEWAHPVYGSKLEFDLLHYRLRSGVNIAEVGKADLRAPIKNYSSVLYKLILSSNCTPMTLVSSMRSTLRIV